MHAVKPHLPSVVEFVLWVVSGAMRGPRSALSSVVRVARSVEYWPVKAAVFFASSTVFFAMGYGWCAS